MTRSSVALGCTLCMLIVGCASSAPSQNEDLFRSTQAQKALEDAPDLFAAAQRSWDVAAEHDAQDDATAAHDYRTRSRLLLAAAIAESERIVLREELDSVMREEAKWASQLHGARARAFAMEQNADQEETRRIAARRVEDSRRIAADIDHGRASRDERNKLARVLLDRAALLLSVAEAIGAPPAEVSAFRLKQAGLSRRRYNDPESVEILLWDVYRVIGAARATRVEPPPGTGDALLAAAAEFSMDTERRSHGTDVWTGSALRRQRANARVVRRMGMLVDAFPHGPVLCRVTGLRPRVWKRLYDDFRPLEETHGGRVTLSPSFETDAQELRCTFTGYTAP